MRQNVSENRPNEFTHKIFEILKPTLLSFNSPWQASQNLRRQIQDCEIHCDKQD